MNIIWIIAAIGAAFFQNLRSAMQKEIKGRLSNAGSAYVRFCYAVPFAILGMVIAYEINGLGYEITNINIAFLIHCMFGGITQILFTVLLLWTFSFRSFAVGTAFSKMEVIFIAMLSYPILGDTISFVAVVAIVIGCFGAILLSQENKVIRLTSLEGLYHKSTWIGIASGLFLGASGVFYRGAILTLEHGNFITKALLTLVVALVFQTIAMGIWFAIFDPQQLKKIIVQWRRAMPIGLIGMITSFCWFTAFALQKATYVRAVGQIELVFTFIATIFFFREKIRMHEAAGVLLIVAAILMIILLG